MLGGITTNVRQYKKSSKNRKTGRDIKLIHSTIDLKQILLVESRGGFNHRGTVKTRN